MNSRKKEPKVRYNPGNLGDLLKHGWLVEIVRFLHRHSGGEPLRYADTFCGYPEYDIRGALAERIRERFHAPNFRRHQEPFLVRGRYAGSVTLAILAAEGYLKPSLYDLNPQALAGHPSGQVEPLEMRSGCDILEMDDSYDLIFLDPYDDIWETRESVLAKSANRLGRSSILLFFPFRTRAQRETLAEAVDRLGVNCQTGFVENPGSPLDGANHFAAIFMPSTALNLGAVLGFFGELNFVAARVNDLAKPA